MQKVCASERPAAAAASADLPQRGEVYLKTQWNDGILGFENGIYPDFNLFFLAASNKDFILLNPLFQPSSIPLFHTT